MFNLVKWGVELKMNWLNWSIPISSGFQFQFNSNSKSFNSIPIQFMLNWIELIINSNSIHELIRALGLSPVRRQAIIWTNPVLLSIGPLGTDFSEIVLEIQTFLFKKMNLKMLSGKCQPFCLGLNVLRAGEVKMSGNLHNSFVNSWPPSVASANRVSIGSDNGLSPIRCQAII